MKLNSSSPLKKMLSWGEKTREKSSWDQCSKSLWERRRFSKEVPDGPEVLEHQQKQKLAPNRRIIIFFHSFHTWDASNVQLEIIMNGPLATLVSQRPNIHQELFIVQFFSLSSFWAKKSLEKERWYWERKRKLWRESKKAMTGKTILERVWETEEKSERGR